MTIVLKEKRLVERNMTEQYSFSRLETYRRGKSITRASYAVQESKYRQVIFLVGWAGQTRIKENLG